MEHAATPSTTDFSLAAEGSVSCKFAAASPIVDNGAHVMQIMQASMGHFGRMKEEMR